MIYISFMELLFSSRQQLEVITESTTRGSLITALAFFGGIFIAGLIDKFIPDTENPHELHSVEEIGGVPNPEHTHRLRRMGIVTALAIAVHNFPEYRHVHFGTRFGEGGHCRGRGRCGA